MARRPLPDEPSPRRAVPDSYHHGDLANALLTASLDLLEQHGAEGFSLRDATARCGVAVSAAYKHYASKGDLLHALADLGFRDLGSAMEEGIRRATRGLSGTERAEVALVALGRAYVIFAAERPNLFRLMYGPHGPRGGGPDARPDAPAHHLSALLVGALDDVLRAYGRPGADLETNKVIAWALVHGFSMMVVDGVWPDQGKKARDQMIEELGQAMLRSLR